MAEKPQFKMSLFSGGSASDAVLGPLDQQAFDFSASPDATTQNYVVLLAEANRSRFMPGFPRWLEKNYGVWAAFRYEADRMRRRGFKHHAARTLIEWIRHESVVREIAGSFKINNNTAPDLSRLYLLLNPDAAGFFSTRGRR